MSSLQSQLSNKQQCLTLLNLFSLSHSLFKLSIVNSFFQKSKNYFKKLKIKTDQKRKRKRKERYDWGEQLEVERSQWKEGEGGDDEDDVDQGKRGATWKM